MLPRVRNTYRLTRDVETRFSADGKAIANVGLASSEKWGDREDKFFIDAVAFGKTGEFLVSVKKGQRVDILGKLKTEQWKDKNDGSNRSKQVLIIEKFDYIEKREDSQQSNAPQAQQSYQSAHPGSQQQAPTMPNPDDFQDSEDIPFN